MTLMSASHARNHPFAIPLHSTFLLATFVFLITTLSSSVYAEEYQPVPMWGMTSVFVEGRALYVHGGRILQQSSSPTMISTSITFSLDLSTTWEASKPNYTLMTTEGPTDYLITSTLISSDNVWIMISNATGSVLRLDGTVPAWSEQTFAANTLSKDKGLVAATDPITGSIYIVNGGLENGAKRLFTFNKDLNLFKEINQLVPMESGFAGAWSVERKRMYIHGGIQSTVLQSVLYEFLPSNDAPLIRFVPSTGDAPTARQGHCMVSAYGGAKMVVFGGFGDSTTPLGDIYILNTTSSTWTKGTDGGLSAARAHTACAVTNDLFVAWGGTQDGVNTITSNITIVYNLKTNQWQSTYSPLPYVASSPPTATASENGTGAGLKPTGTGTATNATSRGSNLGAIIGGVVGGLSVIAIVVALFVYRKRQAKNSTNNTSSATTRPRSTHKEINSPGFNNDQSPYGEAPVSAVAPPPQYNIFQPTTTTSAATGPGYQLAYIDHFQQRHPQDRQQQQEQEQEQTFIHAPQTVPCAPSSPVNSSYTTSTTNSSPVIKYSTKPRITGSSGTELFEVETRHPHTPGNDPFFADIHNADRHPPHLTTVDNIIVIICISYPPLNDLYRMTDDVLLRCPVGLCRNREITFNAPTTTPCCHHPPPLKHSLCHPLHSCAHVRA